MITPVSVARHLWLVLLNGLSLMTRYVWQCHFSQVLRLNRVESMVCMIVRMKRICPDSWTACWAKRASDRYIGAGWTCSRLGCTLVVEMDKVWAVWLILIHWEPLIGATSLSQVDLTCWWHTKTQPTVLLGSVQCWVIQDMGTHML